MPMNQARLSPSAESPEAISSRVHGVTRGPFVSPSRIASFRQTSSRSPFEEPMMLVTPTSSASCAFFAATIPR